MSKVFWLIKFGEKEHLESLMNEGAVYFKRIKDFQGLNEQERGDKHEGAFNIINDEFSKIKCEHPTLGKFTFKPIKQLGQITHYNDGPFFSFSAYALTSEVFGSRGNHFIDKRLTKFGEFALVIKNPKLFVSKVKKRLDELRFDNRSGLIKYKNVNGRGEIKLDFFSKNVDYEHQSEFRVLTKAKGDLPFKIKIGSISDMCFLSSSEDMITTEFIAKRQGESK